MTRRTLATLLIATILPTACSDEPVTESAPAATGSDAPEAGGARGFLRAAKAQLRAQDSAPAERAPAVQPSRAAARPVEPARTAPGADSAADALPRRPLADGSATVAVPAGFTLRGQAAEFAVFDGDGTGSPSTCAFANTRSFVDPQRLDPMMQQALRQAGKHFLSLTTPAAVLEHLLPHDGHGQLVRVRSEGGLSAMDERARQMVEMFRANGLRVDSARLDVEFRSPEGELRRGIFDVHVMPSAMPFWIAPITGAWAPAEGFEAVYPVLEQVLASFRIDPQWQRQQHANRMAQARSSSQAHQQRMRDMTAANDARNAQWAETQRRQEYAHDMFIHGIRDTSTWIGSSPGGEVVHTDVQGAQNGEGQRIEGQPWNTWHYEGQSPWTGEQLEQVNTYEAWLRYQQEWNR